MRWRLPCDAHFYLHPPHDSDSLFNRGENPWKKLEIPFHYYNNIRQTTGLHNLQAMIWSRSIYHILVVEKNTQTLMWRRAIGRIVHYYPVIVPLILVTESSSFTLDVKIASVSIGCNQCDYFKQTYIQWDDMSTFNLKNFQDTLKLLNEYHKETLVQVEDDLNNQEILKWNEAFKLHQGEISFNDFPKLETLFGLSSDQIIFRIVFQNVTFANSKESFTRCIRESKEEQLNVPNHENYEIFCRNGFHPLSVKFDAFSRLLFIRKSEYFTFLSCGEGNLPALSFQGFISAFDVETWAVIALCLVGTTMICISLINKKLDCWSRRFWSESLFGALKLFLEQSNAIIINNATRSKSYAVYCIWGASLAMCVIIGNQYKGENISQISAPFQSEPPDTFKSLISSEYKIYSKIHLTLQQSISELFSASIHTSPVLEDYTEIHPFEEHIVSFSPAKYILQNVHFHPNETLAIILSQSNFSFLKALAPCDKIALAGWKDELKTLHNQLRSRIKGHKLVGIGNENLYQRHHGWEIYNWPDRNAFMKFYSLHESGISNQWINIENFRDMKFMSTDSTRNVYKPLQLSGNTGTIFLLYMAGNVIGIVIILAEISIHEQSDKKCIFYGEQAMTKKFRSYTGIPTPTVDYGFISNRPKVTNVQKQPLDLTITM
ncbi:hypothetical protein Fcan01_07329 [Folsomia candida]|uniref:Uncharacterized protein n=2 Tax=Folsomia candida TaxID=158441 RepID=A0A226EMZ7_FOLCA|nr:hypothetical protein Fcan01_07329 [Folsomia candida]